LKRSDGTNGILQATRSADLCETEDEFEYPAIIDSCPPSGFLNSKSYSYGILEMRAIYFVAFY